MKKILIALSLFLSICTTGFSQEPKILGKTLTVTFLGNDFATPQRIRSTSLTAVLRDKQVARFKDMSHGFGLTFTSGLTPHTDLAISANGTFGSLPIGNRSTGGGDNFLLEVDASGNFKMLAEGATFNPYLIAGIGASKYTSIYGAFVPLGGGLKFNIFDEAHVNLTLQYRIPVISDANNYHFQVGLGIGGLISEKKAPAAKEVPPPADTDGDGIADADDACPIVFGLAKYKGCPVPDTDKDGINDEQDKCPTVPGVAKYNGCPVPDTDNDGINDDEDKCPTVAGVARYNGCPVPDTDGDGVNDEEDKCPTVAGTKANNGCPEVTKEMEQRVNYAAKRIFFITGSAKLSSKSDVALNEVVKILNDDKNVKLSIEGHTDNVGKADYNKTLSEKRAASVKTYLIAHGVDESRLTSEGFGMDKPVASNKTAAGRAQNRRVELKLNY